MARLIIRDGKIAAVGGQVEVPQEAQVINGEGSADLSRNVRSHYTNGPA